MEENGHQQGSKTEQEKIRWGTIIPLIGGSAIGCQQVKIEQDVIFRINFTF